MKVLRLVALASLITVLAPARPAEAALTPELQQLGVLINGYRASHGLGTVSVSATLTSAAQWMASSMATYDYFSHTSIDGRSSAQRMADAGYPASSTWTGEDLAAGQSTASQVLAAWQQSPAHNAVLLSANFRAIGLGYGSSTSSTYQRYWVADFGGVVDGGTVTSAPTAYAPDPRGFHAQWALQSAWPTLAPGQTTQLVVAYRNTGWAGWARNTRSEAHLGTNWPTDGTYPDLQTADWLSANRLAIQTTDWVGPGQLGWFAFTVRAPATPGTYRLAVRPVIDGVTWLEDYGVYFVVTVR